MVSPRSVDRPGLDVSDRAPLWPGSKRVASRDVAALDAPTKPGWPCGPIDRLSPAAAVIRIVRSDDRPEDVDFPLTRRGEDWEKHGRARRCGMPNISSQSRVLAPTQRAREDGNDRWPASLASAASLSS